MLKLPLSTVSLWLQRIGLGKRSRLEPPEPPNRYERRHPGELVHVDIKQLGRVRGVGHRITGVRASQSETRRQGRLHGVRGWEYVHVMVDDHSRLAYAEGLDGLQEAAMVAGVDVHKYEHTVALIDSSSGELATLGISNTRSGVSSLIDWLKEGGASGCPVGVENGAGYGRLLSQTLAEAGFVVLNMPAWRTHRERHEHGRGESDAQDAAAIAQVVLRKSAELAPALESSVVRAFSLLESLRRQTVQDRTQAIQRLRALWTQLYPEREAQARDLTDSTTLRRLRRIELGDGLAEKVATRSLRALARQIEQLGRRINELDRELEALLAQHGNPVADLPGGGPRVAAALIAHTGDAGRFRSADAFARYCGAAPIPAGSGKTAGRHRLNRGGNRRLNAALHRIALVQMRIDPRARAYIERKRAEGKTAPAKRVAR